VAEAAHGATRAPLDKQPHAACPDGWPREDGDVSLRPQARVQSSLVAGRPRTLGRDAINRRMLALADALAAAGALLVSTATLHYNHVDPARLAAVPLIVVMAKAGGLYDREELLVRKSTLDETPALVLLATFYTLSLWLLDGLVTRRPSSSARLVAVWIALFLMLVVFRTAVRFFSRRLTPPERCLVLGDAVTCEWMESRLARRPSLHARAVGRISLDAHEEDRATAGTGLEALRALAASLSIDRLIVTPGRAEGQDILQLIHSARSLGLKVSVLPRVLEVIGSSVEFDEIEGLPLLSVRGIGLSRSSQFVKRAFDLVGSLLALLLLCPLLLVISLAIKLDSPGPVLFRQRRVGLNGETFSMWKFRTMMVNAEEQKDSLRHLNEAVGLFKIGADPRVTRVGRFLRRMSVDELPQLVNVLRGEMSLVGPRPLVSDEDRRIEGWRRRRLHLTPGITGHWQVLGAARIPLEEMSRIDYLYVTNWSLWLDVKIMLRTVPYVFGRRGM
jgi:exopolysaccharide biosynthesis polyprenyl glycosylphosphotransferase